MSGGREHRVASVGGVTIAAVELGPPDAPAVLLGHGAGSSTRFLREAFADPFLAAGWRVVAYDLRGHGSSTPVTDPSRYALGLLAADVAALARRFRPRVVGGVSLGAHAAVAHAVRGGACDAALACLPAWTGRAVPGHGAHAVVAADVARRGIPTILDGFRSDTAMEPWLRETLLRDWPVTAPASLAAALTALDGGLAPTIAELGALPVPLALVSWPEDPGHPDEVAALWEATAPRAARRVVTLREVGRARRRLGDAAVAALAAVGIQPFTHPVSR